MSVAEGRRLGDAEEKSRVRSSLYAVYCCLRKGAMEPSFGMVTTDHMLKSEKPRGVSFLMNVLLTQFVEIGRALQGQLNFDLLSGLPPTKWSQTLRVSNDGNKIEQIHALCYSRLCKKSFSSVDTVAASGCWRVPTSMMPQYFESVRVRRDLGHQWGTP